MDITDIMAIAEILSDKGMANEDLAALMAEMLAQYEAFSPDVTQSQNRRQQQRPAQQQPEEDKSQNSYTKLISRILREVKNRNRAPQATTDTYPSGITPNSVNQYGEPYYSWGSRTGEWGPNASIPFDGSQYGGQLGGEGSMLYGSMPSDVATVGGEGSMLYGSMPASSAATYGGEGAMLSGSMPSISGEALSSASSYNPLGYIIAAIQAQHMMSDATDRNTPLPGVEGRGHKTGDVFSLDFFTEPWQAFAYDKLGIDVPTPGEKTDASINALRDGESTWDNLLRSAPATGAQWFDPFSSVGYDWMNEKGGTIGKVASKVLFPIQWLTRLFD